MKFLITGNKGQLAKEFIKSLERANNDYLALSKDELDIQRVDQVFHVLRQYRPKVVINCAAYNQVDRAEEEFDKALGVNTLGVYNLAIVCQDIKAFLVHFSTDYVFDGRKEGLYIEGDKPNPLCKYALSKFLGELALQSITYDYLLFRVSWVYGEGFQNFIYKLSQWSQNQDYLKIACDEFSVPTSTKTISEITLKALKRGINGLYHLVNSGYTSRYEWAKTFLKYRGIKKLIYPAYQSEFALPAKRPLWSVMSNERICQELAVEIKQWDDELKSFLENFC